MLGSLSRNLDTIDGGQRVIQQRTVLLLPSHNETPVSGQSSLGRGDPLHIRRINRQEVVMPMVLKLGAPIGHTARRRFQARHDLARVHRVSETRRANIHGAPICVECRGWACSVEGERVLGRQRDALPRRRRLDGRGALRVAEAALVRGEPGGLLMRGEAWHVVRGEIGGFLV